MLIAVVSTTQMLTLVEFYLQWTISRERKVVQTSPQTKWIDVKRQLKLSPGEQLFFDGPIGDQSIVADYPDIFLAAKESFGVTTNYKGRDVQVLPQRGYGGPRLRNYNLTFVYGELELPILDPRCYAHDYGIKIALKYALQNPLPIEELQNAHFIMELSDGGHVIDCVLAESQNIFWYTRWLLDLNCWDIVTHSGCDVQILRKKSRKYDGNRGNRIHLYPENFFKMLASKQTYCFGFGEVPWAISNSEATIQRHVWKTFPEFQAFPETVWVLIMEYLDYSLEERSQEILHTTENCALYDPVMFCVTTKEIYQK